MKNKHWILLLALVLAGCLFASLLLLPGNRPATHATILCGGKTYKTLDLRQDQEFTIPCAGGYNTVTVKDGRIAVTEADCPDQYCVRQGFCNSGVEIVCLPHNLVIRFVGDSGIDGAVG